jgi:hypothetical protein
MKVTIEKIWRGEQETRFGPCDKTSIKIKEENVETVDGETVEVGDNWISLLSKKGVANGTEAWTEGLEVDIDIKLKNGYLNFSSQEGANSAAASVGDIMARIDKLEQTVYGETPDNVESEPDEGINPEDVDL